MRALLVVALLCAAGCTGNFPYNPSMMTPEQITANAKDKSADVTCAVVNSPYGRGVLVTVRLDQKVIPQGTVSVDAECKTTINSRPAAPAPAGG